MLQRPQPNNPTGSGEKTHRTWFLDEAGGTLLGAADPGPIRIGVPPQPGIPVDLVPTPEGTELVAPRPLDDAGLPTNVTLWWSTGDARMEVAAEVAPADDRTVVRLAWPPRRLQLRRHRRARLEVPVWLHVLSSRQSVQGTTMNVSVGGMAFRVPDAMAAARLAVGQPVVVVPHLPSGPVGAAARIVRELTPRTFSVEFTTLGAAGEARIAAAVSEVESKTAR